VGVPRSTKDYFALTVMNTILGGSFTSRLNQNLREARGYTYGAGSRFDMRRAAGPFTASAEIVSAKSDSALLEFVKENVSDAFLGHHATQWFPFVATVFFFILFGNLIGLIPWIAPLVT